MHSGIPFCGMFAVVVFMIVASSRNRYITLPDFRKIWLFMALMAALFAFYFEPKDFINWDIKRYYEHLDNIRRFGLTEALKNTEYRTLYVTKYWMYLVSLTDMNGLFTAIPFFVEFIIFGYLVEDINKNRGNRLISIKKFGCVFFCWFSLMGVKLAITDVRCVFAMNVLALAIYWDYICKRKRLISVVLYVMALYIHHVASLVIAIRILLMFTKIIERPKLVLLGSMISYVLLFNVATFLVKSGNLFLRISAKKLLADWADYNFLQYFFSREMSMKVLYLCFIGAFVLGLLLSQRARQTEKGQFDGRDINVLNLFSCLGIGFSFNYLLMERLLYPYAVVLTIFLLNHDDGRYLKRTIVFFTPILLYLLYFNDINGLLVNYLGFYIF